MFDPQFIWHWEWSNIWSRGKPYCPSTLFKISREGKRRFMNSQKNLILEQIYLLQGIEILFKNLERQLKIYLKIERPYAQAAEAPILQQYCKCKPCKWAVCATYMPLHGPFSYNQGASHGVRSIWFAPYQIFDTKYFLSLNVP